MQQINVSKRQIIIIISPRNAWNYAGGDARDGGGAEIAGDETDGG